MGIYIFSMDALTKALEDDALNERSSHDFGHDIIPRLIDGEKVYAYQFGSEEGRVSQDAYWRDVVLLILSIRRIWTF
ncbi:glucose-1-phosphate adenylyltransferase [Vibrio sp. JCM 19236]|nr:glucose-1-phosphate adenylyltransferase [Vibrio sp. JCM 19236]